MERAGSRALSIFANGLSSRVLRARAGGPLGTPQLEEMLSWAPESSLRALERRLCELGALVEVQPAKGSLAAVYEMTEAGHELLGLADALERWLRDAPRGPVSLADPAAQGIVKVMAAAWQSTIVRTLAERPHRLTELSARMSTLTYPALRRRLAKLHSTGLIEPVAAERGAPFEPSEWLRRAVAPLLVATRWERRHDTAASQLTAIDVEAALLSALPLVELPTQSSGNCVLAVLLSPNGSRPSRQVAGVRVEVSEGKIVATASSLAEPQTWALGDPDAWFAVVVDGDGKALRIKGVDPDLAEEVVGALRRALFHDANSRG